MELAVNPDLAASPTILYELKDEIALRNAGRCQVSPLSLTVSALATVTPGTKVRPQAVLLGLLGLGNSADVTFTRFGPSLIPPTDCSIGGAPGGTGTPNGNGVPIDSTISDAAATLTVEGTYWWYASWPGDVANGLDDDSDPSTANVPVPVSSACNSASMTKTVVATETIPPTVTLTVPANGATVGPTPTLSGAAGNAVGDSNEVKVYIYNGVGTGGTLALPGPGYISVTRSGATWTTTSPVALPEGTYTAQATQVDNSSNLGTSNARQFTVDTTPPVVTVTAPADGSSSSNQTPTFTGTAGNGAADSPFVSIKVYRCACTTGTPVETRSAAAIGDDLVVDRSGCAHAGRRLHGVGVAEGQCRQHRRHRPPAPSRSTRRGRRSPT